MRKFLPKWMRLLSTAKIEMGDGMSYITWHTYGYGICVADIQDESLERLQKLISMAPEYQKKIQEWLDECGISEPAYEDYLDFDQEYMLGLAMILKEVILEAEDIDLVACDNYDGIHYLIYAPDYPWNQKESRQLENEEDAKMLFQKYVSILTDKAVDIDYQSVENGG